MGGGGKYQDNTLPSRSLLASIISESNVSLADLIQTEDRYITQRRHGLGLTLEAQEFLLPFWKTESSLKDLLPKLETCRLLVILFRNAGAERLQFVPSIIAADKATVGRDNLTHLVDLHQTSRTFENIGRLQLDKFYRKLYQVPRIEQILLRKSPEFYERIELSRERIQEFIIGLYRNAVWVSGKYTETLKDAIEKYNVYAQKFTQPLLDYLNSTLPTSDQVDD